MSMKENELRYIHDVLCGNERPWRIDKDMPEIHYKNLLINTPVLPLQFTNKFTLAYEKHLLFTSKIKYYCQMIHNESVGYLNEKCKLIDTDNSEELTKYILNISQKAIETLINEAKSILDDCHVDIEELNGDNADFYSQKDEKEKYIILNYTISLLIKCWMELQDRYSYVINEVDRQSVKEFSVTTTGKLPNKMFVVLPITTEEKNNRNKQTRTDCSFLYVNNDEENKNMAFEDLHQVLVNYGYIPNGTSKKDMIDIFSGRSTRAKIIWLKDNHILATVMKKWINEQKIVSTYPESATIWQVVSQRFTDAKGNPLPNLGSETERKKTIDIVDRIVKTLSDYC